MPQIQITPPLPNALHKGLEMSPDLVVKFSGSPPEKNIGHTKAVLNIYKNNGGKPKPGVVPPTIGLGGALRDQEFFCGASNPSHFPLG